MNQKKLKKEAGRFLSAELENSTKIIQQKTDKKNEDYNPFFEGIRVLYSMIADWFMEIHDTKERKNYKKLIIDSFDFSNPSIESIEITLSEKNESLENFLRKTFGSITKINGIKIKYKEGNKI